MNYNEIHRLARRLPPPAGPVANPRPVLQSGAGMDLTAGLEEESLIRFLESYKDLDFGWRAASRLAAAGSEFPVFPERRSRWVYLGWRLLLDREANIGKPVFAPLLKAWMIEYAVDGRPSRDVLRALLIAPDTTLAKVAAATGLPVELVDAYESLFYNVLDRRDDSLFLRNVVYPNTRLEEMIEGYFEKGNLGNVLLKMGYNRGMDEVLYFAGFRTSMGAGVTASQATDLFQTEMMFTGYMLARNGFLHHDKQHVTIGSARGIVQASKIGGEENVGQEAGGTIGEVIREQLGMDVSWIRGSLAAQIEEYSS